MEVTLKDQEAINSFGRLNNRKHEIEDSIKVKKKVLEDLEDAGNELMLADEEVVKYRVGGVFVQMDTSSAEERIEAGTEAHEGEVSAAEEELAKIQAEMGEMKKVLYGRFGDAINLEE